MAKQNKHLEHIEDLILLEGRSGADKAIKILRKVGETLTGAGGPALTITTKWDGAPAVVAGIDPSDGKFFVGTKSVFNKESPKVCKQQNDIQRMYGGELASKLSYCLRYLKNVVTEGVLQGDLLFTNDKSSQQIMGKSYVIFRPNTITYAAETGSKIGNEIQSASVGIVFHTRYTGGPTLQDMSASFGVKDGEYNKNGSVWAVSATFQDVGNVASFSGAEKAQYEAAINKAEGSAKQTGNILNKINTGGKTLQFDTEFKKFFNAYFRDGRSMDSVSNSYNKFLHHMGQEYAKAIKKNKTLDAQAKKAFIWLEAIDFAESNKKQMMMVIATYQNLLRAKNIAVNKMNRVADLNTFVETNDGYKVTAPEGYVAISGGQAVKLIDRLEFSNLNFTVPKKW